MTPLQRHHQNVRDFNKLTRLARFGSRRVKTCVKQSFRDSGHLTPSELLQVVRSRV